MKKRIRCVLIFSCRGENNEKFLKFQVILPLFFAAVSAGYLGGAPAIATTYASSYASPLAYAAPAVSSYSYAAPAVHAAPVAVAAAPVVKVQHRPKIADATTWPKRVQQAKC